MKAAADFYMQNKYGISAELEKYELQFGEYYLWMKTQDKEFFLFLNEEFQPLSDAYQYDEIRDALTGLIRETYPGIVSGEIQIYNPPSEQNNTLSHIISLDKNTKFTGNNLEELLDGCSMKGTFYYAGVEFSDCTLFQKLRHWNSDIAFVSFDTQEHLDSYLNLGTVVYAGMWTDVEYYDKDILYAPYITQIWRIDKNGSRSTNYPLKNGDGFCYCCPSCPDIAYFECQDIQKSDEHSQSPLYQFGHVAGYEPIYVFIPADSVPDGTRIAWFSDNLGETRSGFEKFCRCGDYQVFFLSAGDGPTWYITDCQEEIAE